MVRLYLTHYNMAECTALLNALRTSLQELAVGSEPRKDIESTLNYLSGYMDAMRENRERVQSNVLTFERRGTGNKDV